jgi:hypothetical protein
LSETEDHLASLRQVNELARFNNWLKFDVVSASQGEQIGGSLTLISPVVGRGNGFEARLVFPEPN